MYCRSTLADEKLVYLAWGIIQPKTLRLAYGFHISKNRTFLQKNGILSEGNAGL